MRKFLALVLALVMTMSLVTVSAGAATAFTDDAAITNEEAVEVLNAIGILGGYADGSFRPQGNLTRGAGAKMIAFLMLGEEAANELKATYTVFEDVTDTVGNAAYIEWAEANGIVGGYGNGKFGPYDTLTQYAFGKMLLTAIGFKSAEEGYTGAGWQKNVFGDAYAKGIFDGSETYGACLREDAARMVMAALETTFVVYGSASINNGDFLINGHIASIGDNRITVDGAWDTDLYVWQTYEDLYFNDKAFDTWGNPGDYWEYDGEEIGFYEDAALKTYTTKVDNCALLVDLGIAASSSKTVDLKFIYNGDFEVQGQDYVKNDKKDADRYYITGYSDKRDDLGHADIHVDCDDNFIGGQGVLTKVFATETKGEYLVTEVATYLAKVDSVVKTHAGTTANLNVGYRSLAGYGLDKDGNGHDMHTQINDIDAADDNAFYYGLALATADYAKGDYVLVTVNKLNKDADASFKAGVTGISADALEVVTHELAVPTLGVLTGWEHDKDAAPGASKTKIDYAVELDAFGFSDKYGYDSTKVNAGETYNFYFDNDGNVIGAVKPEAVYAYAVVDFVWADHKDGNGKLTAGANVVTLDGVMNEGVNVVKFNGVKAADLDEETSGDALGNSVVMPNGKENDAHYYYLYTYSVKDGNYTLNNVLMNETDKSIFYYGSVTHTDGDDDLFYYDNTVGKVEIQLTPSTQILMRDVKGNYTAAVGYEDAALKALTAKSVEFLCDDDGYAEVVFLNDVTFLDAYVTGYIVDADCLNLTMIGEDKYYEYTFFVNGVATQIFLDAKYEDILKYYGLYEAQFDAVGGNLVVDKLVTDLEDDGDAYYAYGHEDGEAKGWYNRTSIEVLTSNTVEFKDAAGKDVDTRAESLTDVAIYVVDTTSSGTDLKVGDITSLSEGAKVDTVRTEKGKLTAIYVLL